MPYTDGYFMSKTDLLRLTTIQSFTTGMIDRNQAAEILEISSRQVSRIAKRIRENGVDKILHGNRGKAPANKLCPEIRGFYLRLYQEKYFRFNFKHALEWIKRNEAIPEGWNISYESFRCLCRSEGLGKVKKRRPSKARIRRERFAHEGAVLQMDGSHHVWYGGEKDCLVALIDDATSKIPSALFAPSESTWACMKALRHVVETQGIPGVIITDQAGWAGGSIKRPSFSQFGRICEELGIILIRTSTAQAKGRVERLFRTTQDRLIAELDHLSIQTRDEANQYLQAEFLPQWDRQFTVESLAETKHYRVVSPDIDLDRIFCMKHSRTISRDQTVYMDGLVFSILNREWGSLAKREVTIYEAEDGALSFYLGQIRLDHKLIREPKRPFGKRAA